MVRRLNRVLQLARDAVVTLTSVVLLATGWGKWVEEPVWYILLAFSAAFIGLSVVSVVLVAKNVKNRAFYFGNAIYQLFPSFILVGLLTYLGVAVLALNVAVLATLGVKKTPEELLKHPPVPITRNYRIVAGVGTLVMLGSMFAPWLAASGSSFSLFGVYSGIVTQSDLPGLSISPLSVIFALMTLVLSPVAQACGALALVRRRFSLVSGVLAVISGVSIMIVLTGSVGFGAFGFIAGGAVVLAAYFGFRRAG